MFRLSVKQMLYLCLDYVMQQNSPIARFQKIGFYEALQSTEVNGNQPLIISKLLNPQVVICFHSLIC